MKIIVCLKEVLDPALSLDNGLANPVVLHEGQPRRLNPNDAAALRLALDLKLATAPTRTEITLVSIGPERVEAYLRNGLASGADRAMRIREESGESLSPSKKSRLLAAVITLFGADLVLTGARSLDTANGQVGPLIAARLGWPCVSEVVSMEPDNSRTSFTLLKDIGRGRRERIWCPLPAVVTIKGNSNLPYANLDNYIESRSTSINIFSSAELQLNPADVQLEPARVSTLLFPRPPLHKAPPLDSSLPAFYRILQLLEGGIARRKGRMLKGSTGELVEQLFQLMQRAGVFKTVSKP
jgi:electron transfer flavoprotein alpha/beta subunit